MKRILAPTGLPANTKDEFRERLAAARKRAAAPTQIPRFGKNGPRPTSLGQQRLYYLHEMFPNSHAYHLQLSCDIEGLLDAQQLENAITKVVRHHEVLHSVMSYTDGKLTSEPKSNPHFDLRLDDLTKLTTTKRIAHISEVTQVDGSKRFDLQSELPMRGTLFQCSAIHHVLLLTFHHIAVDERSLELILTGISDYYCGDVSAENDLNSITYADVVHWRSNNHGGRVSSFNYWRNLLKDAPSEVMLPGDLRTILPNNSASGRQASIEIPSEIAAALLNISRSSKATPFILQLAAFAILLHRYSGANCVVIGAPISSRIRPELQNVVGFFVETLPIRIDFPHGVNFSELLTQVRDRMAEAIQNIGTSFDEIVKSVNASQQYGRNPVFNVMFAEKLPLKPIRLGEGLNLLPDIIDSGASKFDMTMFAGNLSTGRDICIEYNSEILSPEVIEGILSHWIVLLNSIVENPDRSVANLKLTTPKLEAAANSLCGESLLDLPSECVQEIIRQRAMESPKAIAVQFDNESLTYEELNDRADQWAVELQFDAGSAIAVCYERSAEMIVAILAILKAGHVYVPIAPGLPSQRLSQILESSAIVAILTQRKLESGFTSQSLPVIFENANQPRLALPTTDRQQIHQSSLCYVIHTSGSTGQPKGVEVTHGALLQSTLARTQFYQELPDCFLLLSPIWFDSSVAGIFWTLCAGGTLVIPTEGRLQNIKGLAEDISLHSVTHTLCLPSVYKLLLRHAEPSRLDSLKSVIVAGESCPSSVVREHFQRQPSTKLFNEYGPTEASVWATVFEFCAEDIDHEISIGRAAPGIQIHLVNSSQQPVPPGVPGEIYIGGTRLAKGYRNSTKLTNEKFIQWNNQTVYRTGDMARLQFNGSLTFLGRVDDQIKINGQRIEPAEIESLLSTCPGVTEVAVGLVEIQPQPQANSPTLLRQLEELPADIAEALLSEAEQLKFIPNLSSESITRSTPDISVQVKFRKPNFIRTPRERQRKWLLDQALQETISDLTHLDQTAKTMVPGSDQPHVPHDLSQTRMSEQEIMEDWQTPLMQTMAGYACEAHGDVLEIGFGRGVAASFIQASGVQSHTIVEMNQHSIKDFFVPWQQQFPDKHIRLVEGRWQDVLHQLTTFDTVFFHAFPMNAAEFIEYIAKSATFAEHFFPTAASLLRPGGAFTYMTTETDSVSRRHQRSLLAHFDEVHMKVERLQVPEDTCDAWWATSMVVLKAIKASADPGDDK